MQAHRKIIVLAVLATAPVALAAEGVVEAVGEAPINNGNTVAAKKAATGDALRKCVEQIVGVTVKNEFTSDMQETVRNNQNSFNANVRDKLLQQSEGFIQKYDVLDEQAKDGVMRVKVRAHVFESKIRAEVKKLTDLINAAGNPKLMLVIQDVYVSASGDKRVEGDSLLAQHMESELLKRGFELKGGSTSKGVADKSLEQYDHWMDQTAKVAELARSNGADIVIYGRVEIRDTGAKEKSTAIKALEDQVRIEIVSNLRGMNAATGELLSSEPVQMRSFGINTERALQRALKGKGDNLIQKSFDKLLEDLKQGFQKMAEKGQGYAIRLKGVSSYKGQGREFLRILEQMQGVSGATQKAFSDGELVVELSCKCSSSELQDRIFQAAQAVEPLKSLDVDSVSGKSLSFKL